MYSVLVKGNSILITESQTELAELLDAGYTLEFQGNNAALARACKVELRNKIEAEAKKKAKSKLIKRGLIASLVAFVALNITYEVQYEKGINVAKSFFTIGKDASIVKFCEVREDLNYASKNGFDSLFEKDIEFKCNLELNNLNFLK